MSPDGERELLDKVVQIQRGHCSDRFTGPAEKAAHTCDRPSGHPWIILTAICITGTALVWLVQPQ